MWMWIIQQRLLIKYYRFLLGKVEFFAQAFKHRAAIKIPGLDSIQQNLIHRADLELPAQYQTAAYYSPEP